MSLTGSANALPEGESVVAGTATFDRSQENTLSVTTPSDKLIVNYNAFGIGAKEAVQFNQPSSQSVVLNRVVGTSSSEIFGTLKANGKVFVVNPNGILFGRNSHVDVAGLLASTMDISNDDFLNGRYVFTKNGSSSYVINQGEITAQPGGYVILLSQAVSNQLSIVADLGTVALASGEKMTLSLDDNRAISVVVDDAVKNDVIGPDGQKMLNAVDNQGTITANGGKVLLTAKVLNNVFDHAINNTGVIQATSLVSKDGVIELCAEGAPVVNAGTLKADTVTIVANDAAVVNTGTISATHITITANDAAVVNGVTGFMTADGSSGGMVKLIAETILQQGTISANAFEDGKAGEIQIVSRIATVLDTGSVTEARAVGNNGDGGSIIINSTAGKTKVNRDTSIDVSAGEDSGNAGVVEVSAFTQLGFYGLLNGRAPPGYTGAKIVFDPTNVIIRDGVSTAPETLYISAASLAAMTGSLITVDATNSISINTAVSVTPSIEFNAGHAITVNANVTSQGNVTFKVDARTVGGGDARITVNAAHITAANISMTAYAYELNSSTFAGGDPGEFLNDFGLLNLSGPVGYAGTDAIAEILVNSGAYLDATNAVSLTSTAESIANVTALGLFIGIAYADSTATATTEIKSGATVKAGGALTVEAKTISTSTAACAGMSQTAGVNISIAKITATATAHIADGASILSADSIGVTATNENTVSSNAGPFEVAGDSEGLAVSDVSVTSTATASIDADITLPTNHSITITAHATTKDNSCQATAEPKSSFSAIIEIVSAIKKYLSDKQPAKDSKSETLNLSAALAIAQTSITADAHIGSTATIKTGGNITIDADTEDNFQIFAASESEAAKASLSGAIAYGKYESAARAYIANNATVIAGGLLSITATAKVPNQFNLIENDLPPIPTDVWDAITSYGTDFEGLITEGIFTSYIRCSAPDNDEGFGLAGTVNMLTINATAEAYIGEGAQVNQDATATYRSNEQAVSINSYTSIESINLAGVFSFDIVPLGSSGKASVGGTYNQITYGGISHAYIADHAVVSARKDVTVQADSNLQLISIAVSGGEAEKFGINGTFSLTTLTSDTRAFIEDEAVVTAISGNLKLTANDTIKNLNIVGGVVKSENIGVGFSVAINNVTSAAQAFVGNYFVDTDTAVPGSVTAGTNIELAATSTQVIGSFSLAAAFTSKSTDSGATGEKTEDMKPETPDNKDAENTPDPAGDNETGNDADQDENGNSDENSDENDNSTPSNDETGNPDEKKTEDEGDKSKKEDKGNFGLGVSGDVSLNTIDADTLAYIDGTGTVDAGQDLKLTAMNDSTVYAIAGSVSISTNKSSAGIAGSFTKNTITDTTKAYLAHTTAIADRDIILSSTTTGDIKSIAAGAAGAGKVGVAGSVSYNVIGNVTESYLDTVTIAAATPVRKLTLTATDSTGISAIAGALGFGKDALGFGASVAINSIANTTKSYIKNSRITTTGDVVLTSSSTNGIDAIAGSLGVSKAAGIAATMAWNTIKNETDVFIADCVSTPAPAIMVGGKLSLNASDTGTIRSISGAVGAGKSVGAGVGASYNEIASTVRTVIANATVKATGIIELIASSTPTIKTISAGGGVASKLALAGAVALNKIKDIVSSSIASNAVVTSDAAITVTATDAATIEAIAGTVGASGTVSVGAAVALNNIGNAVRAFIQDSIVTSVNDGITLSAISNATIKTLSAGASISGKVAINGAISLNYIHNVVAAYIMNSTGVTGKTVRAVKDIVVLSKDTSTIDSLCGQISGAGAAAIGASVAFNKISNSLEVYILRADVASSADTVIVKTLSQSTINTIAAGGSIGGYAGIAGSVAVNKIANTITAFLENSLVAAHDTIIVLANSDNDTNIYAGTLGAGAAGIGGSAAVNLLNNTTKAFIKNCATSATNDDIKATGTASFTITELARVATGIAVLAFASEDVEVWTGTLALGAGFGIAATVSTTIIGDDTQAYVDNARVMSSTDVEVRAQNDSIVNVHAGVLSIGGSLGAGATSDITLIANTTKAFITTNSLIDAVTLVAIESAATVDVDSYIVAGAASPGISLSGAVTVMDIANITEAYCNGSTITSDGGISIRASDASDLHPWANATAIGTAAGLGGAVVTASIANTTTSHITDSVTNAQGTTEVAATSSETITPTTTNVNAGFVGAGGAVTVTTVKSITKAYINATAGKTTSINQDATFTTATQNVVVTATDSVVVDTTTGALSFGVAGLGASVEVTSIKNTVSAYIAGGATVSAGNNVAIRAIANKTIDSLVVAFGGGGLGVQGAVSIINIGSGLSSKGTDAAGGTAGGVVKDISNSDPSSSMGGLAVAAEVADKTENLGLAISDAFATSVDTDQATTAYIGTGAHVSAGTYAGAEALGKDIIVAATDTTSLVVNAGAGSGGIVGIGGGVAIATIQNRTHAFVDAGATLDAADDVFVSATTTITNASVNAYAGTAGVVGLGAAVSYVTSNNLTTAVLNEATVFADAVEITATTIAPVTATAGSANVGALAAGVVIANAAETSTTEAAISDAFEVSDTVGDVNSIAVRAHSTTTATATASSAVGGLLAGNGAVATANANPTVRAAIGADVTIDIPGAVIVDATAIDTATATAKGVTVAALGAGASFATAVASPVQVSASIGNDTTIISDGDIAVTATNTSTAYASASASAGALIGVTATDATATCDPSISATIGDDTTIETPTGECAVTATNTTNSDAIATGWCLGLAAFGSNSATATVTATTLASLGKNVVATVGELLINAYAVNDAYAYAQAGAGGLVAGAACKAATTQNNTTGAYINDSDSTNTDTITATYDITVLAEEKTIFNAQTDSTSAGIVGMSGADILNIANSWVTAGVGKNNALTAGRDIAVLAINRTDKPNIGVNLSAGAGGLFGGAAGNSVSYINNYTSAYVAGNDAGVLQKLHANDDVVVLAENIVAAYDKGHLSAGGLISGADVHSHIYNSNYATSSVGANAIIESHGDVSVLSHAIAVAGTVSNTVTWGLASKGDGTAEVAVTIDNDANVGAHARITADGDINVGAGEGLDDIQNYLYITANSLSWVSGGIPLSSVHGYATLIDYSDVVIVAGAQVRAGEDVNLQALRGFRVVYGYARAKKKTYLFFGIPITIYSNGSRTSDFISRVTVTVDGTVESGVNRHRTLSIDKDGVVTGNIGYTASEINLLERLNAKIDLLQSKIDEYDPNGDFNGSTSHANADILNALYTEYDFLIAKRESYKDKPNVPLITLNDAAVSSGDINISGTLAGTGSLIAPGNDFLIRILNDSFAHLEVNKLEIPESLSGKIILNGKTITAHPTVHVDPGANLGRRIEIINLVDLKDPIRVPDEKLVVPSDIVLSDDIINYTGSVLVLNNSGSIATSGNISAQTITIKAPNGSFVHEYTPGLYHAGTSIVGDSIYISSEILDINGTLQSGLPYRYITIPAFDPETDLYSEYEGGPKVFIPIEGDPYAKAVWDAENNRIILYRVAFKGGTIELFGEIVSTTTQGKLKVMDGYGEIVVTNKSSRDFVISGLDIGERVAGKIKITDTGYYINNFPRITLITADGADLNIVTGYRERLTDGTWVWHEATNDTETDTRTYQYDPYAGARVADFGSWVITYKDVQQAWDSWWDTIMVAKDPMVMFSLAIDSMIKSILLDAYGVAADNRIGIEFLGNTEKGILEILNTGSGTSDVYINGGIYNKYGDITITNEIGSIYSLNDTSSLLLGRNVYLTAPTGAIGSTKYAIPVDVQDGALYATALTYVNIAETSGDLVIASVTCGGDVRLAADGQLYNQHRNEVEIVSKGVTLVSYNAGVGLFSERFLIDSLGGVVSAEAYLGIYLTEVTSDMNVGSIASATGDVYLNVPGAVLDANTNDRLDDDTLALLTDMAEELQLQDEQRILDSIADYKEQKKDAYLDSHRLDDNGTPFDATDDTYDIPTDEALAWEYELSPDEEASFYEGLWTDEDMINAKNVDTLPDVSGEYVEDPNISGVNIVINAGAGVGSVLSNMVILKKDIDEGNLTMEQRIALAMAEPDDITFDGENVIIQLKSDVDVQATGTITVTAKDHIYLGSEQDVNIDRIESAEGDIRLKIAGSIINSAIDTTKPNIVADDLIIESYKGYIGTLEKALVTELRTGGILNAMAHGMIYLTEAFGDMLVGCVESEEDGVYLTAANGNILPATGGMMPNVIAAGPSVLAAPAGMIGINAAGVAMPIRVRITDGPLVMDVGKRKNLKSAFIRGTIASKEFPLPVINPASYPSPLYPSGGVYFNGERIWPPSSNNPQYLMYLAQASNALATRLELPDTAQMKTYQINTMDLMAAKDKGGPVYFYHPLTVTDIAAFEAIDTGTGADMYRFIDGAVQFSGHDGLAQYFDELDEKKKKKKTAA